MTKARDLQWLQDGRRIDQRILKLEAVVIRKKQCKIKLNLGDSRVQAVAYLQLAVIAMP